MYILFCMSHFCFFCFKQKTAYEMRISDWSSDVCSSDLRFADGERPDSFDKDYVRSWVSARCDPYKDAIPEIPDEVVLGAALAYIGAYEIGRASCRERVCQYV